MEIKIILLKFIKYVIDEYILKNLESGMLRHYKKALALTVLFLFLCLISKVIDDIIVYLEPRVGYNSRSITIFLFEIKNKFIRIPLIMLVIVFIPQKYCLLLLITYIFYINRRNPYYSNVFPLCLLFVILNESLNLFSYEFLSILFVFFMYKTKNVDSELKEQKRYLLILLIICGFNEIFNLIPQLLCTMMYTIYTVYNDKFKMKIKNTYTFLKLRAAQIYYNN